MPEENIVGRIAQLAHFNNEHCFWIEHEIEKFYNDNF